MHIGKSDSHNIGPSVLATKQLTAGNWPNSTHWTYTCSYYLSKELLKKDIFKCLMPKVSGSPDTLCKSIWLVVQNFIRVSPRHVARTRNWEWGHPDRNNIFHRSKSEMLVIFLHGGGLTVRVGGVLAETWENSWCDKHLMAIVCQPDSR